MIADDLLSSPRSRRLGFGIFLVVSSIVAGYGVYEGKMKILAILALFTGGFLLRQASIRNAYWLAVTALQFSHVRSGILRDEFEMDRWLGLAFMAALSLGIAAVHADRPAWPGIAHLLAGALLVVLTASASWSHDPYYSLGRAGSVGLVLMIAFVGLWSHGTSVAKVREIVDIHIDMLWIVFPLGMVLWLLRWPGTFQAGRFQSIYENPNALGMWCSVGLPLAFGLALSHPVAWRRRVCWLMLVTGGLMALLSGSRGGVAGAALGISVYAAFRFRRRVAALAAGIAVVTAFSILYGVEVVRRSDTLMTLVRPDTLVDMSSRKMWWEIGALIAAQRPMLGHGFGTGESLFSLYRVDTAYGGFSATVHNTYLAAWMEVGWVGLGLLLAVSAWACWLGYRTWRRDPQGERGLMALALLGSAVALIAHSYVEEKLLSAGNPWMLPYWTTLALMARLHRLQRQEDAEAAAAARMEARPRAAWVPRPQPAALPAGQP